MLSFWLTITLTMSGFCFLFFILACVVAQWDKHDYGRVTEHSRSRVIFYGLATLLAWAWPLFIIFMVAQAGWCVVRTIRDLVRD